MRQDTRTRREADIAAAAYALIEEKGYAGTSMLAIARAAKASNETLYNWYGDKLGLFRALITRNASEVREILDAASATGAPPMATLRTVAPLLLTMVLGERAIALNRAAAADPTGQLGQALADAGRNTIAPLIRDLLLRAQATGEIALDSPGAASETFIHLLIGDRQIRRAIGVLAAPSDNEIAEQATRALDQFERLYAPRCS